MLCDLDYLITKVLLQTLEAILLLTFNKYGVVSVGVILTDPEVGKVALPGILLVKESA